MFNASTKLLQTANLKLGSVLCDIMGDSGRAILDALHGPRKAIIAVAASILTPVYWMLRRSVGYTDLGADHFDRTDRTRLAARLARKLGELGFEVALTPRASEEVSSWNGAIAASRER